eukprot:TRINITY_DN70706_c0_g1_i1.p1 TRINITY_DN70706_c0_g1~~TRINITY_DN70706_c0_g1_i1.p1  ORF type:complete len:149 (-),score=21.40 TRINITY_DN70706_c0_g1_i1:151-555(-)
MACHRCHRAAYMAATVWLLSTCCHFIPGVASGNSYVGLGRASSVRGKISILRSGGKQGAAKLFGALKAEGSRAGEQPSRGATEDEMAERRRAFLRERQETRDKAVLEAKTGNFTDFAFVFAGVIAVVALWSNLK